MGATKQPSSSQRRLRTQTHANAKTWKTCELRGQRVVTCVVRMSLTRFISPALLGTGWLSMLTAIVSAAFLCLAPLVGYAQEPSVAPADRVRPRGTVAVLPFSNISGQAVDEWIGAGIAESLMAGLHRGGALTVIGPEVMQRELRADLPEEGDRRAVELARRVGATWVVTGSYQRSGDQLRITARVVDVTSGRVSRTVKVDGVVDQIFALQDRVAAELGPDLHGVSGASAPVQPRAAPAGTVPSTPPALARSPAAAPRTEISVRFDGPPAPVPPAVVSERDAQGRLTVRAVRLTTPLRLDGRLDEEIYQTVPSFGDLIQNDPDEGQPASDKTEAWIFFDDRTVYVSARLWSRHPDRLLANAMRRDSMNIYRNDWFGVTLDTLFDRRSGFFMMTNALGGVRDALVTDESRSVNFDYNMVWDVKSQRFDQGWTTEFAIPFKSLRYVQGREQVWGLLLARKDWWNNEMAYLMPMPRASGPMGSFRVASAAVLVGIEAPPAGLNLEVKPYVTGNSNTIPTESGLRTDLDRDFGLDLRYGLTKSLTADITYNTDFAQVEVDEQQLNLTRFSLFFPEKREFFLEGQGLFTFGGAQQRFGSSTRNGATAQTPIVFFSRRIGLHDGQTVPIKVGGRLLGKVGSYNLGLLSIRTDAVPSAQLPETTFSVMRVKKDILRRSGIGLIATARTPSLSGHDANVVAGADLSLALFENLEVTSYYARSRTLDSTGDEESYRGRFFYNGDKYGLDVDYVKVGDAFNPEAGFLARNDFRRMFLLARFSPRPRLRGIRRLSWDASVENIEAASGAELQTRMGRGSFRIDFESGDSVTARFERNEDRPQTAFPLAGGVTIQPGVYRFNQGTLSYQVAAQRKITGTVSATTGEFYGGTRNTVSYNGRVEVTKHLAVEPRASVNWLDLPQGKIRTELYSARTTYLITPRSFVAALLQYNSAANVVGLNARFRWEYRPGSDFFFVYSEGRDAAIAGFPTLSNRQVAVKFTRLFRF